MLDKRSPVTFSACWYCSSKLPITLYIPARLARPLQFSLITGKSTIVHYTRLPDTRLRIRQRHNLLYTYLLTSRVQQHFSVPFDSPIELVISVNSFIEGKVMRNGDGGWFSLPSDDQVTKVAIIGLITLSVDSTPKKQSFNNRSRP